MNALELETKWGGLTPDNQGSYKSLRLSGDCLPDLYIGMDTNGARCLILKLPGNHSVNFKSINKQNLSIEFFKETSWIVLKLSGHLYKDLFNDLIISLYNKIKDLRKADEYSRILIDAFYRWSEFFDDNSNNRLSDEALIGILGEIAYLIWEIQNNNPVIINDVLSSWTGPFDKGHDFMFTDRDIEVKTKRERSIDVSISSEFQLQSEPGKNLRLVIVNVADDLNGITIYQMVDRVRSLIVQRFGDFSIFLKALAQKGLTSLNLKDYDHLRFKLIEIVGYDCTHPQFPKITASTKSPFINTIRYNIRINELGEFIVDRYDLRKWN